MQTSERRTHIAPPDVKVQATDHEPIELSDGCILSARIWRPETAESLPAILEIHPYPKRYATAMRDEINHGWFARHEYVSIRVDSRGGGDSQGHIIDEYRPQEHSDILEVIEWIAAQEWCNGSVGMFGHSWGAYSSLQMAALSPPALKAIAISGASDDLYAEDCHFRGGVMASEHMGWAATMLSFFSQPPDPAIVGDGWREMWLDRLENIKWVLPEWLRHPTRDEHWRYPSICENYDAVKIPVLAASGWLDVYANSIMRMAVKMPRVFKGVIGPWAHKFPHMGLPRPAIGWLEECVQWWDRWLKGIENDAENLPRLRVFISENVRPETASDSERNGRWVSESEWPSRMVAMTEFQLGDGRLGADRQELALRVYSPQSLGTASGELMPMGWGADLPSDQRQDDGRALIFDTLALEEPVDILGQSEVDLCFSVDRPVAICLVRLCDVAPDGTSTRVCYGALNLTHSDDHEQIRPLDPGERYRVKLLLDATAYRFCEGHRIRLALSTAYWPLLWPPPEPVTLTVFIADSRLLLPMRTQQDEVAPTFGPPDGAPHMARTIVEEARSERTVDRNLVTGETIYRVVDWAAKERSDAHGLTTWGSTERVYRIRDEDPASCEMLSRRNLYVGRSDHTLRTLSEARMSCSKSKFFVEARLTGWEGDRQIFDRSWMDAVPRNGS